MLTVFRRLIYSKVGAVVAVLLLGVLALLMVGGDISSTRNQGFSALGGNGAAVVVGDTKVSPEELTERVQQQFAQYRQQNPQLTLPQFVAGGGFDATVQQLINGLALDQFGRGQGMEISKRAVDGQIASFPGLQGPNGQFDASMFRQVLAQQKITERNFRADIARSMLVGQLTAPLEKQTTVPLQLAMPYANLSLQRRSGTIAFVPSAAMATGTAPTDAELHTFYSGNVSRYTVPERRSLRIARVTADVVRARVTPSEADIAAAYRSDAAKYAATEKRAITQVVVLDQSSANSLAAKAKAGTSLAAAASASGLASSTKPALTKAALAGQTSPALADAVFAASQGSTVGPVRGGIGFIVARIDKVEQVAGKSLAQAQGEIATALTAQRTAQALSDIQGKIDDALGGNSTFDEVVKDNGLAAQVTAPLLQNGVDPERPATPDPALTPLVAAGFGMAEGDEPQMVPTGADGSFALVALARVVPAAPRPLASIRDRVAADLRVDRASQAARKIAGQILARVNGGATMQAAWTQAGVRSEGPKPLSASREDVDREQGPSRAPLALMFAMAENTAKLLEAPGGGGWAVIRLDRIQQGDASRDQPRIAAVRQGFGQLIGREYTDQFARAARKAVGVTINKDVIAKAKAALLGGTAQ